MALRGRKFEVCQDLVSFLSSRLSNETLTPHHLLPQYPEASPPIILVQGVFGSGKSTLLVVVVLFLLSVFKKAGLDAGAPEGRILISAATNVAVDNILLGLLDKVMCAPLCVCVSTCVCLSETVHSLYVCTFLMMHILFASFWVGRIVWG